MTVSVISTPFNRRVQLRRGLSSLARQAFHPDEIIIVDDGSTDGTNEEVDGLKQAFPHLNWRYIRLDHSEHRISCIPRNIGIQQATGDTIVFTEAETLHVGETLKAVVDACVPGQTFSVATQVWSLGPEIYHRLNEGYFLDPMRVITHPYAMIVSGNMQNTNAPNSDWGITGSLNCWAGCLVAVAKSDLLDIGGFDEEFTGFGWDDFDVYARLEAKGMTRVALNETPVIHLWHLKNYPYNIYEHSDRNGTRSVGRLKSGEYRANIGREWGKL